MGVLLVMVEIELLIPAPAHLLGLPPTLHSHYHCQLGNSRDIHRNTHKPSWNSKCTRGVCHTTRYASLQGIELLVLNLLMFVIPIVPVVIT